MNVIRMKRHIDSETLLLTDLSSFIGKDVEVIILEEAAASSIPPSGERFSETAGKYPDFDEVAFLKLREVSKI